jgi:hypothetical protein
MKSQIKLKFLLTVLVSAFSLNTFGQAFEQGKSYAGVGYGIGLRIKSLFFESYLTESGFDIKNTGVLSLKYDYALDSKWSVGIYFATQNVSASWKEVGVDYETLEDKQYSYEVSVGTTALLSRIQYHFQIPNEKLDVYTGVGLGYRSWNYESESDDILFDYNFNLGGAFGFCYTVGARYEFTPILGAFSEFGLGQVAAMQAGVVAKF